MAVPSHPRPTDQEIDLSIANMLRFGISLAAVIVLLGGILYLLHAHNQIPDYARFHDAGASLDTVPGILRGLMRHNPFSIIQFGLLVLIATPVVRVAFCIVGFARQHDRIYILISTTVLLILLFSLIKAVR